MTTISVGDTQVEVEVLGRVEGGLTWYQHRPRGNLFPWALGCTQAIPKQVWREMFEFCTDMFGEGRTHMADRRWWMQEDWTGYAVSFRTEADMVVFLTRWSGEV